VGDPEEGGNQAPIDGAAAGKRFVQVLELVVQLLRLRRPPLQTFLQIVGLLGRVRVEEEINLCEVVCLDDPGAVLDGAARLDERPVAHRPAILLLVPAERRMPRIDAAVDDRPAHVPAGDVEEAPARIGFDGEG
jgi:hypothetical protein